MDDTQIRSHIQSWYQRANREGDPISKFVFLWFCFNAWLAYESGEDSDRDMINWLKGQQVGGSQLRACYDAAANRTTSSFSGFLKELADLSPITSTGRRHRVVRVESTNDFPNIVQAIYQVRCNLFHGGKRSGDVRDEKLVGISAHILEKWVGNLVEKWPSGC